MHQEAQNAKPSENAWIEETKKNLEDRIGRQTSADFDREFFNKDLKQRYEGKGKMVNVEDWHEKSARRAGAAEVTALLNTADIPPLGYTGDIRDLHKKRLLSEDELELADAREAAIPRMHDAVERARQMKIKEESDKDPNLKAKHDRAAAMQKDVAYDSDITTSGEDTDEEL